MTQVLDAIRRLDEAHGRGEISDARYRAMRREVLELVEEAEVTESAAPPSAAQDSPDLLKQAGLLLLGLVVLAALVGWLTRDPMMGLTLSTVLLAGVVIHAAQGLIAEDRAEAAAKAPPPAEAARAPETSPQPERPALDTYDEEGRSVPAE